MEASRKNYFSKLASLLSEKHKVKIIVGGMQAKTDGKTVYIPDPDNFVGVDNKVVEGFIDHEIAHVHFTKKGPEAMALAKDKQLLNALEDVRVEAKMCDKFKGSKKYLVALEEYADATYPIVDPVHMQYRNMQRYLSKKITRKSGLLSSAICDVLDKVKLKSFTTLRMAEISNEIYEILNAEFKMEDAMPNAQTSHGAEGQTKDADDCGVNAGQEGDSQAQDGKQKINASGENQNDSKGEETQELDNAPKDENDTGKKDAEQEEGNAQQGETNSAEQELEPSSDNGADSKKEEKKDYTQSMQENFGEARSLTQSWIDLGFSGKDYAPITEFDTVTKARYSPSIVNKKEHISQGLIVASRLKGVFDSVGRKPHDATRGRINPKNLYRILTPNNDNPKVCIEQQKDLTQDIAISIAVDASGSMDYHATLKGLIPLCIALEALKIRFSVFSFNATKNSNMWRKVKAKRQAMPFVDVREMAVNMQELKNVSLPVSAEYITSNFNAWGGTPTADAVIHGHKLLQKENAKYKMLFVFTDGKPTTSSIDTVSRIIKKQRDVITIGVGLGFGVSRHSMSQIFGERQFSSTKYDVPMPVFCTELRKVLERCI